MSKDHETVNKTVMAEWATRLESGEYHQGRQNLRSADGLFCCLGVLCEIAVEQNIVSEPEIHHTGSLYLYNGAGSFPPDVVSVWAFGEDPSDRIDDYGYNFDNSLLRVEGYDRSPVDLNDTSLMPFAEIAKAVRETYGV